MTDNDAHDRLTAGAARANDFWHGYERSDEIRLALVNAIDSALIDNPTMRLGQLISMLNHELGGIDIWNVYDEALIRFFRSQDKPHHG